MTYIQANFCNSMADMDLFFLQICATIYHNIFFLQIPSNYSVYHNGWKRLHLNNHRNGTTSMLEGFLTFLATLVTSRTNLGNDEATQCIIEINPFSVIGANARTMEINVRYIRRQSSGSKNLEQGLFTPIDEVWEEYYDPLHVLLRAVHRRDFQSSLDRFTNYVKSKNKMPASDYPPPVGPAFSDPCRILSSETFIGLSDIPIGNCHRTSEDTKSTGNDNAAVVECEDQTQPCYRFGSVVIPQSSNVIPQIILVSNPFYPDVDYDIDDNTASAMEISPAWLENMGRNLSVVHSTSAPNATTLQPLYSLPADLSVVPETGLVIRQDSQDDDSIRDVSNAIESAGANSPPMEFRFSLQPITMASDTGMDKAAHNQRPNNLKCSSSTPNSIGSLIPFLAYNRCSTSTNMDLGVSALGARRAFDASNRKRSVDNASMVSIVFSCTDADEEEEAKGDSTASTSSAMDVDCEGSSEPSTSSAAAAAASSQTKKRNIKVSDSRIGDEIRRKLWPNQREKQAEAKAREAKEKEERRKRARERQMKMMQDFANKQKEFMQTAAANKWMQHGGGRRPLRRTAREKNMTALFAIATTPSTESNPIGLVVLVESSGIVGHRRRITERLPLPLSPEDEERLKHSTRLATEFNRRTEILSLNLAKNLLLRRLPKDFIRQPKAALARKRRILFPQLDRPTPVVRSGVQPFEQLVSELTNLIKENERPPTSTKLSEAMGRAMEDMTNVTNRKMKRVPPTFRSLFIFVTSIPLRTNLESEIIQRGGSLSKKRLYCTLLHVLSVHVRVLVEWPLWSSWHLWPVCRNTRFTSRSNTLLLKFILLAPLHLDQGYVQFIILSNCCTTVRHLTDLECDYILANFNTSPSAESNTLSSRRNSMLLKNTNRLSHLRRDSIPSTSAAASAALGANSEDSSLAGCRTALLRQHLYRHDMPEILAPGLEFVRLVYYLELVTDSMDWDCFNASKVYVLYPAPKNLYRNSGTPTDTVRELVLLNQHAAAGTTKLLELPREYERLFTYYHERPCLNCYKVPKESSHCLLCGTIVCLKQNCCAENECCEAVRHTITCGGGIGIFLVVTSTYIIVIRGRRACLWGSLYLDDFDEEDRDLKRGKPLYLSRDRL
ncbi:E3 ubiquitin-protein ligase UBR3 [Lucilia cuprina]|nr:E3 ubiquitin-protein ligase UBR3 [Lucilia cuprina]